MVRHVASIAEIVADVEQAVRFYRDVLGLAVEYEPGSGYAQVQVAGTLHFGLWSRAAAAESTLGDPQAAEQIPLGFSVGFEVDEVTAAEKSLSTASDQAQPVETVRLIRRRREEPWGQVTARFLAPGGGLAEIAETPWARRIEQPMKVAGDEG
ncbi:MAG: hypothetical protein R3300_13195 [Candidatus Promineifilaceae bacterium]|nr:hypothetical protein [Candidatus Promineifilaceae bacterium]